jgi:uncharacterized GH25 family protein
MTHITLAAFKRMAAISSLFLLGTAHAHHLWIEQDSKEAKLYFGEFGENLREASPGRLDRFGAPTAAKHSLKTGAAQAVSVSKAANGFALSAQAAAGESLVAQDLVYPISERKEPGAKEGDKPSRVLYVPAARLVADYAKQTPQLTLDIVPTGMQDKERAQVQVFFKGQPLAKASVEVITSAGWSQTRRSDEQGLLTVRLPWRGVYVLEVKHSDGAGVRGADAYDKASYVTSLTVMQTDGVTAIPATTASVPSKMN